jgi:hypothetical protein
VFIALIQVVVVLAFTNRRAEDWGWAAALWLACSTGSAIGEHSHARKRRRADEQLR